MNKRFSLTDCALTIVLVLIIAWVIICDVQLIKARIKAKQPPELFGLAFGTAEHSDGDITVRNYYMDNGDGTMGPEILAVSFGPEINDYRMDIDGDGQSELFCNTVSGGDGCERLYVYKRSGDLILLGIVDETVFSALPHYTFLMAGANASRFDPKTGKIYVRYTIINGGEEYCIEDLYDFESLNIQFGEFASLTKHHTKQQILLTAKEE